jgi:hypothetical protein
MTEANVQYQSESGFEFKAIGVFSSIKDAESINRAYANNTPGKMWGAYAEVGYNLMKAFKKDSERSLVLFSRFEAMDLNAEVSSNSSYDGSLNKQFLVSGLTYTPTRGVVVKLDVALKKTGTPNPILSDVSGSQFSFINIGLGYSF